MLQGLSRSDSFLLRSLNKYVVKSEQTKDKIESFRGGVIFVLRCDVLLQSGRLFLFDVSVFECHDDVGTDVVVASFTQTILLNVVYHLACTY